jgi:hypothetical protein
LDSGWPAPEAEAARPMNVNGNGHHGGREIDQLISREERLALKQPPNDEEAELACVAAEMYAPGSLERVGVVRSAFYHERTRKLFDVLADMREAGAPVAVDTLRYWLRKMPAQNGELPFPELGVDGTVDLLESHVGAAVHIKYFAERVRQAAAARTAKERALAIADAAQRGDLEAVLRQGNFSDLHPEREILFTFRRLAELHPKLRDPLIDGLLRRGEVANIIAPSKIGKSWLTYGLALSVITGRDWFGFPTTAGLVCLIDNELHEPTIVHRIRAVAEQMEIPYDDYADSLTIWPMRGRSADVFAIGRRLNQLGSQFALLILDAKYRAVPGGANENSNEDETAFYNEQDRWAKLGPAVANIHHSTKGSQSDRRVTDVGAGGGAQSRAADTHVILREHEDADTFVLEAAVRSFKPVDPIGLRWEFPLWIPDTDIDPKRLKRQATRQQEDQSLKDAEADRLVLDACPTWRTKGEIREATGLGSDRATRSIGRLVGAGFLERDTQDRPRHKGSQVFRKSINAA